MSANFTVVERTAAKLYWQMPLRNPLATDADRPDTSGYTFKLIVKRDVNDTDAQKIFEITAAHVDDATNLMSFQLNQGQTGIPPGDWPCMVRWWITGSAIPPDDAETGTFTVNPSVANP